MSERETLPMFANLSMENGAGQEAAAGGIRAASAPPAVAEQAIGVSALGKENAEVRQRA